MRIQDYEPPKLTLGVVGLVAIIIPILLGYFLVSGLGTSSGYQFPGLPTSTTVTTTSSSGAGSTATVSIPAGAGAPSGAPGYAPDTITVVIGVNNTVVWTNNDGSTHHTVTSSSVPPGAASFNSGDMAGAATFNYTFTTPGTYQYICSYHSWMAGTVVVKAGGPSVATVKVSIPSGASAPAGAPGFAPDTITVVLGVNSTVSWSNDDSAPHTVTSDNTTGGSATFDSGNLPAGQAFTYTFTAPGTYPYHCNYHSWMKGTVIVKAGSAPAPAAAGLKVSIPSGAGNPNGAPGYAPDKITLVIGVNNTVTWTNDDGSIHHTVTSTSVPQGAASFNSGDMAGGATYTYTFTVPGTYQYDCLYHSWMTGTVTVVQGP